MGACAVVECPECHKEFVVTPSMLGLDVDFHCPYCDKYFAQQKSPRIWKPDGTWSSGLAGESVHKKNKS